MSIHRPWDLTESGGEVLNLAGQKCKAQVEDKALKHLHCDRHIRGFPAATAFSFIPCPEISKCVQKHRTVPDLVRILKLDSQRSYFPVGNWFPKS